MDVPGDWKDQVRDIYNRQDWLDWKGQSRRTPAVLGLRVADWFQGRISGISQRICCADGRTLPRLSAHKAIRRLSSILPVEVGRFVQCEMRCANAPATAHFVAYALIEAGLAGRHDLDGGEWDI